MDEILFCCNCENYVNLTYTGLECPVCNITHNDYEKPDLTYLLDELSLLKQENHYLKTIFFTNTRN
jgi:hypothetical protein